MIGISIKPTIGVGDALQFSSAPENYFRATGKKLVDVSRPWFFDHNPFVLRDGTRPNKTIEMWNFSPTQYEWPNPRKDNKPHVYLSNAEIWASVFGVPCAMNRPRLYRFEEYPYEDRSMILLQTFGVSHGEMPQEIVDHVVMKYSDTGNLFHIGPGKTYGLRSLGVMASLWDLAEVISKSKMLICLDSGPAWVAACYHDVVIKKVRTKPNPPKEQFENWVPLEIRQIHSHWDDRCHQIFNTTNQDIGFTYGYKRI